MVCLHFTLVTLKDQCQGHSDLEGLYLILIQVCRKLPFVIPTASVKQRAKVLGLLVCKSPPKFITLYYLTAIMKCFMKDCLGLDESCRSSFSKFLLPAGPMLIKIVLKNVM